MTSDPPEVTRPASPILDVRNLRITFPVRSGSVRAVAGLDFSLDPGRSLGIVGQSGSGKSATALALLGLHRGTGARVSGQIIVDGDDINAVEAKRLREIRASKIAMVFQDPLSALDPFHTVGDQIAEVYRVHTGASRSAARARAVEVLDQVRIPDATRRAQAHPHEFSGGMRQRALIAMALACRPRILVADEPTTALDVTVQAQILDLLDELRAETGMALVLISHDLGVVAGTADDVVVMHRGTAVEHGPVESVLLTPQDPYTRSLLAATPRLDQPLPDRANAADVSTPLVRLDNVSKHFPRGSALRFRRVEPIRAVDGVTLDIQSGETLGIVGESGSGKTTLARMLVRLSTPTSGRIVVDGTDISTLGERALRPLRRDLQMVFQDPMSSLNPRRTVGETIADPLRVQGETSESNLRETVAELMTQVGLDPAERDRYPHEFSGGMRQRVGIARALSLRPRLLVCDEPVSSLDVSTQARILDLLREVQQTYQLTVVFVAHDLAVVRQVADRVAVMHNGRVVELATTEKLFDSPQDPYTRALLDAVPLLHPAQARAQRDKRRVAAGAGSALGA
jgi:peptide/nickel transport system ATP-binding protein